MARRMRPAAGRPPDRPRTDIARQICESLGEAYAIGLTHRDIKPPYGRSPEFLCRFRVCRFCCLARRGAIGYPPEETPCPF